MFKRFFNWVHNGFKDLWNRVKDSKIVKIGGKIVKGICSAAVIVTAFNAGNIMEAVSKISDQPITFADTIRWIIVMCGDWIKSVKARNFTWDVKQIFIPLVIAVSYVVTKISKNLFKFFKWIKNVNTVMTANTEENIPRLEVVNPFDN